MQPYDIIAEFYDLEHADFTEDIAFYRSLVTLGPVLEVGVGSGRIAAALLAQGLEVWGVDSSAVMLERARTRLRQHPGGHLHNQRVEDLDLDGDFATVLFSLNALWHVHKPETQRRALERVRAHTLEGAMLVVDTTNPLTMADRNAEGLVRQRFLRRSGDTWLSGFSAVEDDPAEQILDLTLWYDTASTVQPVERRLTQLRLRYLFRHELELLLHLTGFAPRQTYGSYDLEPYSAESPSLLVVAEAV